MDNEYAKKKLMNICGFSEVVAEVTIRDIYRFADDEFNQLALLNSILRNNENGKRKE